MVDYLKSRIRPIRYITGIISVLLMVISLGAFAIKGLNMGLDFTGGMVTEAIINHSVTKSQLMDQLQPVLGESVSATPSGEEGRWVIRYPLAAEDATPVDIATELHHISDQVQIVSNSMVGSQVGQELIDQGGLALLICLLSILGYLSFRFEWRLASGALLALLHDVILVLGFFA
ncbi:protein translocase subunit SecF, partial [Vibrio cholerae]